MPMFTVSSVAPAHRAVMLYRSTITVLAAAALSLSGLAGHAAASDRPEPACYTDWAEAVDVIRRESLTSIRDLHTRAKERQVGDVVRVTLCTSGGVYTYRLLVREPQGRVTTLTVSATEPFMP